MNQVERKPRVFLIQEPRRDLDISSALEYGELVKVLGQKDSPSLAPGPSLVKLRQMVQAYDPETDFLMSGGGDHLAVLMAGMLLADENKAVTWLRWDRNRDFDGRRDAYAGRYVPVCFNLRGARRSEWDG